MEPVVYTSHYYVSLDMRNTLVVSKPALGLFDFQNELLPLAKVTGQPSQILLLRSKEIEYPTYSRTNCQLKCVNVSLRLFLRCQLSRVFVPIVLSAIETALYISSHVYGEHAWNRTHLMLSRVPRWMTQIKLHVGLRRGNTRNRS